MAEAAGDIGFKDRKVRLVVLGVLQIILGGICALFVPLMTLGMAMSAAAGEGGIEGVSPRMMIPGILVYAALAVWFIWMGIGSIKTRRWARALILVSSWLWLICGVLGFVFAMTFLPDMYDKMGESGKIPKAAAAVTKLVMAAFLAVVYIVMPGVLVLLYSGKDVKATCEYRDPQERWTDRCPLPVLAVSFVAAFWAVSLLSMGIYNWTIPFFGRVLSGTAGAIAVAVLTPVLIYIAWGTYKLDIKAWWLVLLVHIGWSISAIITLATVSMEEFYKKMNFSQQQLEITGEFSTLWWSNMGLYMGFWAIAVLVYILYIHRYFSVPFHTGTISQGAN